jgi:glycosyltransferase involved in cell wall biosynthesis
VTISPDQLHIIRCYDRLPPLAGGMERHIAELTAAQRRQDVRVTEVYNSGVPEGEALQLWSGRNTHLVRPNALRWSLFYFALLFRGLDFSDGKTPVLHVHGDWHAFLAGRLAARRFGIGTLAASLHEWARASDSYYRYALRGYAPIFTTGAKEAKRLRHLAGGEVIHLPSAPSDLFFESPTAKADPVDVIAAGTINARKNYELLVDCAALLPGFSFAIYGDGPQRPHLEALAGQKGLRNVRFAGSVSAAEMRNAMGAARLFVSTAMAEGSPTAALEAMACGLPVVMTPSNDYSTLIDTGANGIVTSGWGVDELASAVCYFLDDPRRLNEGARRAQTTAATHRWENKARTVTYAMIAAIERCKAGAQ